MLKLIIAAILANPTGGMPVEKLDISGMLTVHYATRYDGVCWTSPIRVFDGPDTALLVIKKCEGWRKAIVLVE